MRILVLGTIYFPEIDGHVRLIHNHSSYLARRNHEVILITPKRKTSLEQEIIDGVHVIRISTPRIRGRLHRVFRTIALVRGIVRERRLGSIDIVYAFGILPGIAAFSTKFLTRGKIVLSLADLTGMRDLRKLSHRLYRLLALELVKVSDLTVFPTQFAMRIVLGKSRVEKKKVQVIYPGTDLSLFTPDLGKRSDSGVILYAGILRRRKGLDVLIKSFSEICEEFPSSKLVLVGGGAGRWELEKLASNLSIPDRILFAGRVSDQELKNYHSTANIYVMPTQFDAYATSLVEAMAMGEAVVATKGSAPAEIVQDGKDGILFELGNEEQLTETLRLLLSNRELANNLGREATITAKSNHSLDQAITRLEAAFRMVRSKG